MRYLYALLPGQGPLPLDSLAQMTGVKGAAVDVSPVGPYHLVHSAHDGAELLRTRRLMLAHTRVLEALLGACPLLPMRFGLVAESLAEIDALVREAQPRIDAEFARITGNSEIGLRISWPRDRALSRLLEVDPTLARARDALLGRGAEAHFDRIELGRRVAEALERRRTDAQSALLRHLAPLCRDHVLRVPEEDVEVLRMECLVPEAGGEDRVVAAALEAAATVDFAGAEEPMVKVVGPVPPFNFVNLPLLQDRAA